MPDEVVTAQESAEAPVLTPAPTIPGGLTMWNDTKLMNLAYRTAGMLSRSGLVERPGFQALGKMQKRQG